MFDWLRRTVNKYSRGLVVAGTTASSAVAVGYVCKEKLLSWQREQMEQLLRNTHIEQHYLQHYNNMTATLLGYFDTLYQRINACCDTENTIRRLKEGTIPKVEGWELLKRQTFSKLLLTLYSSSLLSVFVSVQLTIVSANIFKTMSSRVDNAASGIHSNTSPTSGIHDNTTKIYLSKITYLLDYAIPEVLRICECEVERVVGDMGLDSKLSYGDILVLLDTMSIAEQLNLRTLCRIDLGLDLKDGALKEIILQTLDIVDSQDFRYSFLSTTAHNKEYLCKLVFGVVKQDEVLVAKLLPGLTKLPNKMVCLEREEYVIHTLNSQPLKVLCCNLYQGLTAAP